MTAYQLGVVAGGALLWGIIRETWRSFRTWKTARLALPVDTRNAGFWTDRRVIWTERSILAAFWLSVAAVMLSVAWLLGGVLGWWCWPYCPL